MSTQSSFASDAEILQDAVQFIKTRPNASQQDVVNYLLEGYNPIDPAEASQFARDAFQQIEQAAAAVPTPSAPTAHPAITYLLDLFLPGDCIDLFYLHRTTDEEPYNYFTSVEQAGTEQEMRDVATNQQNGYNSYIGMNAYKPGGGRSKQNIASIRSVYVEHDDRDDENDEVNGEEGRALISALVTAGTLPKPHYVIRSSMNPVAKYQTVWLVEGFSVEQQECLNRAIRNLVKSDPASCDAARVLRLPGTLNLKYDPPGLVEIVEHNPGPRHTPGDFKIETEQPAVQPTVQPARVPDEDNAFKQLAAEVGYRPFERRIYKQLEPGATIPCPMPWHKHKDFTPCFGPMKSYPEMLHCLGNCQFSGDVVKAVFEFDNATTPGKYTNMKDAARQICLEENLQFEQYFPAPVTVLVGGVPAGSAASAIAATADKLSVPWSEPDPLVPELRVVLPFEEKFLPAAIRPWCTDVSRRMSVSLDFTGICALVTIAGAIGRRAFVYPKEFDKEWKESIALSGAVVAPSGRTKTPVWKVFTSQLAEIDQKWREEYAKKKAQYDRELENWESVQSENKKKKNGDFVVESTAPAEPDEARRCLVNDATPEALQDILRNSPEGVLYYRDELSSWVAEFSKKERENELGLFLAAMNGNDRYTLDRIGRGVIPAIMCASVFGGFQPEMFRKFLSESDGERVAIGMVPRFALLVWPDEHKFKFVDYPADQIAKRNFQEVIIKLSDLTAQSVQLHFAADAQQVFNRWLTELAERIELEPNAGKQSYLSKCKGGLPKLAALLQIVDLACLPESLSGSHAIDLAHLQQAIQLSSYLESHASRVYGCIQDPVQKAVHALVRHLKAGDLPDMFSGRYIQRRRWAGLIDKETVEYGLEQLEEKGWIRRQDVKYGNGTGNQTTTKWQINPSLPRLSK